MKKTTLNLGVIAASAALLVSSLVPAQAAYQSNGSFGAVHLYNGSYVLSNTFAWDGEVVGSASSTASDAVLSCPSTSTGAATFLSAAANTTVPGSWNAFAPIAFSSGTKDILQPNLSPASQVNGNALGVKTSGGTFNLGVACTSNNGVTVLAAYYRTITVTASTGAYTAAATATDSVGTSLPTPTWAVKTPVSPAPSNREANRVYVGDLLEASVVVPAIFPGDYVRTFQWKRNGNAIASQTAATYTVLDGDGYAKISVDVIYTAEGVSVTKPSTQSDLVLGGSAVLGGNVAMSAGVSSITNGFLELSIPAAAAAVFTSPTIENNYSVTRGTLGNITINDSRWVTTDGWDLTADVDTFKDGSKEIAKSNFGLAPRKVANLTTATGQTLATSTVAGSAQYPTAFASAAKLADLGDTGVTVLNADLTLRAPRTTLAGTYTSKVTLTLATK
jgi:hypothetical protein